MTLLRIRRDEAPERMRNRFKRLDQDGDGYIDQDEIQLMMQRMRKRSQ